jgi:hypothetical protein
VATLEGGQFISISLQLPPFCNEESGLIRGVVSLEGGQIIVFYYFIASEIWPDKWVAFGGNDIYEI